MELEALKTHLTTVQALYGDDDSSVDDIVFSTARFVQEAHTVAKLLLLEGRYAELQRCLHLCQRAFYPPHSDVRLTSLPVAAAAPPPPAKAPAARDVDTSCGSSISEPQAGAALGATCTLHDCPEEFHTLQQEFWSFLNDDDAALFCAMYQRTRRLQKQLDEARRTTKGRDTAYYIHKLVENRGDAPSEYGFPALNHPFGSPQRPPSSASGRGAQSRLSGSASPSQRLSRHRFPDGRSGAATYTSAAGDGWAPAPPERGVSLGNRTKLNRWKVGRSLQPLVTSRRVFLGDGGDGDDESEPLFGARPSSRGVPELAHRDLPSSSRGREWDLPSPSPSTPAPPPPTSSSLASSLCRVRGRDVSTASTARLPPLPDAAPLAHRPSTSDGSRGAGASCSTEPGQRTSSVRLSSAVSASDDPAALVFALNENVTQSLRRAEVISAAVEAALRPRRLSPTVTALHGGTANATAASSDSVTEKRMKVHVDEVSSHDLSAVTGHPSRTLTSSLSCHGVDMDVDLASRSESGVGAGGEECMPTAADAVGVRGTSLETTSTCGEDSRPTMTPAPSTDVPAVPSRTTPPEEHLVLVTADCPADRKLRALDACRYQAHPQVRDVVYAHLMREKAEENLVLGGLINTERKGALQPPWVSATMDAVAENVGASLTDDRRGSADVGTATVAYLRSRGQSRLFESKTTTRSLAVFNELRSADREVRRRSRVLGISATSDDALGIGETVKRLSGSGMHARSEAPDEEPRGTIVLPNVFFLEDADDDVGDAADIDDWEASLNRSRPGRTASTVSELKSTLTAANPSFRSRRALLGLGHQNASFVGFTGKAPSRVASMFSFRTPAAPGEAARGTSSTRATGRVRKDSVVMFTNPPRQGMGEARVSRHGSTLHASHMSTLGVSLLSMQDLRAVRDWTTVSVATLQSNLSLCVCAVRIQTYWRRYAARKLVRRLARRVHRHRDECIREGLAARRLQRVWRERLARQALQHRRALRDYVEERRVAEELALYPSGGPDEGTADNVLSPLDGGTGVRRRGSFYLDRPMRYASYASLSHVGPDEGEPATDSGSGVVDHEPCATAAEPSTRAQSAGRARTASFRRRSARNSFHMVPSVQGGMGSRRGSFALTGRPSSARRASILQTTSPTEGRPATSTAASSLRPKVCLPIFGVPPTLSGTRCVALQHLQRHIAARRIARFLRESLARAERLMQREVFALSHYLTGQWTRRETYAFIHEEDDDNERSEGEEEKEEEGASPRRQDEDADADAPSFLFGVADNEMTIASSLLTGSYARPAAAASSTNAINASLLTFASAERNVPPVPPPRRTHSGAGSAWRRVASPTAGGDNRSGAALTSSVASGRITRVAANESTTNLAALVERTTGDVYEKFIARSTAAREAGNRLTVLHRVSLKALEEERRQREAEAARLEEARQQRLRREAEERRAQEARRLDAIQLLQRVGRAARRRLWLRARHQDVEERRNLQYRSQLFTSGFAEASMRSLEGSVDLFSHGMVTVSGAETEEVLPTHSTMYIHHMLAARHPGWYSHDTRRQQAEQTTSVVVTIQRFLRAHLSTDVAFLLYLHRQATSIQKVWRGHYSRMHTAYTKALEREDDKDAPDSPCAIEC